MIVSPRTNPQDAPTDMSGAIHMFKLRRIWSRIHLALYSNRNDAHPINQELKTADVARLRVELDEWRGQVPSKAGPNTALVSAWISKDAFELAYFHSILLLYRGDITQWRSNDVGCTNAFFECAHAAQEICCRYRRVYLGDPVGFTWGVLHVLFVAGLTYLHCLWTSIEVRKATRVEEVRSTCTACTMVLMVIAERFESAASYRDIFEELAARTTDKLTNHSNQYLPQPQPADALIQSSTITGEDEFDITQRITTMGEMDMSDDMEMFLSSVIRDVNDSGPPAGNAQYISG